MNREQLQKYISEQYGCDAEYPWIKYPDYAVFRHAGNKKWFALIMSVAIDKLGVTDSSGAKYLDIVNVKCDPILVGSLLKENGFFPAYHMNKSKWISIAVEYASEEQLKGYIDMSFELTAPKLKKRLTK